MKIAYLSGLFENNLDKSWTHTDKDISALCDACIRGNPSFRGVDILLTSQWPAGIIADNAKVSKNNMNINWTICHNLVITINLSIKESKYKIYDISIMYRMCNI